MRITFPLILAALATAMPAGAHEVWIERDGSGPARIYLGEPALPMPAEGDPEWHRLKAPVLVPAAAKPAAMVRRATHLEAPVTTPGDVRVRDDSIFDPWAAEGVQNGAIFYARAGRAETEAKLDLELVPVTANADSFTVVFRGKPLSGAAVNVVSPDRWQKTFTADAQGRLTVPSMGNGRYIMAVTHGEDAQGVVAGKPVAKLQHVSTLTFVR